MEPFKKVTGSELATLKNFSPALGTRKKIHNPTLLT